MKKLFTTLGVVSSLFLSAAVTAQPLVPNDDFDMVVENNQDGQNINLDMGNANLAIADDTDGQNINLNMGDVNLTVKNDGAHAAAGDKIVDGNTYKVYNVSQQNADAQVSGAREGDVLRYEFAINSVTEDVVNFAVTLDISEILKNTEIIDSGLGNVNEGIISFPSFTQQAPCTKMFTFFVRVKTCEGQKTMGSSGHGISTSVDLTCELAQSGPGSNFIIYMMIAIAGVIFVGVVTKRSSN